SRYCAGCARGGSPDCRARQEGASPTASALLGWRRSGPALGRGATRRATRGRGARRRSAGAGSGRSRTGRARCERGGGRGLGGGGGGGGGGLFLAHRGRGRDRRDGEVARDRRLHAL